MKVSRKEMAGLQLPDEGQLLRAKKSEKEQNSFFTKEFLIYTGMRSLRHDLL